MSPLYRSHRALLAPSTAEEAFPRVIVETALRRTASIGTDRGGIPEAIGGGGVVLSQQAGTETWAEAIRRLDHRAVGQRARRHAAGYAHRRLPALEALGVYPSVKASST